MLDPTELAARWTRVRERMEARDLDVIVAIDLARDEILLGHQRWLTGFTPVGQPAAALVFRDGHVELVSPMLGRTAPAYYATTGLPIELVPGFSPALLAERIGRVSPRRVGYAEANSFSHDVAKAICLLPGAPQLFDVGAELLRLRAIKSAAEMDAVRRSCAIADAVWAQVPHLFRVGRKTYEVIADVDHLVKSAGGERGFYLLAKLPILGLPMQAVADPEVIAGDTRYMLEVSPRYQGYYSQLTAPVLTRCGDDVVAKAYGDLIAAKEMAQPLMRPGADLTAIAAEVDDFLKHRGHQIASRSLGHLCGMALEEPRHDPSQPFILQRNMTIIFHPVLAHPELTSLMRADTYAITDEGAERLNRLGGELLQVA